MVEAAATAAAPARFPGFGKIAFCFSFSLDAVHDSILDTSRSSLYLSPSLPSPPCHLLAPPLCHPLLLRRRSLDLHLRNHNAPHALPALSFLRNRNPPRPIFQPAEFLRQDGVEAKAMRTLQRHLNRPAELRRVRSRKRHVVRPRHRVAGSGAQGGGDAGSAVRVEDVSRAGGAGGCSLGHCEGRGIVDGGDGTEGLFVADALALEVGAGGSHDGLVDGEAAVGFEGGELAADVGAGGGAALRGRGRGRGRVVDVVGGVPEEALKVGGYEDVHGGAERPFHAVFVGLGIVFRQPACSIRAVDVLLLVPSVLPEAVQDVVCVGGDDEFGGGEASAWRSSRRGRPRSCPWVRRS